MSVFFDTNVWVYAAAPAPRDLAKQAAAKRLIADHAPGVSGQVLQEFYHVTVRKRPRLLTHDQAGAWIDTMLELPFAPIDAALVQRALQVSQRYDITGYDGAIVAAAERLGADTLFTEDLNDGQIYGGVRAVNPFT